MGWFWRISQRGFTWSGVVDVHSPDYGLLGIQHVIERVQHVVRKPVAVHEVWEIDSGIRPLGVLVF